MPNVNIIAKDGIVYKPHIHIEVKQEFVLDGKPYAVLIYTRDDGTENGFEKVQKFIKKINEILTCILNTKTAKGACKLLIDKANSHGGEDNITVAVARVGTGT